MFKQQPNITPRRSRRAGFTLVELLVVISVIGLLLAILFPAIGAANKAVKNAAVASEISSFDSALSQFQSEYGSYPPSNIILYESGSGDPSWTSDSTSGVTAADRQLAIAQIRKIWPQFDFSIPRDINNDGDTDDFFILDGRECLVFFLGGFVSADGVNLDAETGAARGFAKNPANPFDLSSNNRVASLFEFDSSRFTDLDGDQFPEYVDEFAGQQTPYLYLSSYNGKGYRTGELPPGMIDVYRTGFSMTYSSGWSITSGSRPPAWKANSYQLISPGEDGGYGLGGYYVSGMQQPNGLANATWSQFLQDRQDVNNSATDNVTNFAGKLQ